ncbi:hypothetical protein LWC35_15790 [Pseudonocardia kujensis]|uniref:hypothetical protein n=1 Tax=Pseudonocardia kujensis TaxID=1128675 RepID=UPI001E2D80BD|nr:hypothetical protein [Pseudonocardia kujensis]MCE0764361.1 hypothetical protein [Pseudonocardia kujensis]
MSESGRSTTEEPTATTTSPRDTGEAAIRAAERTTYLRVRPSPRPRTTPAADARDTSAAGGAEGSEGAQGAEGAEGAGRPEQPTEAQPAGQATATPAPAPPTEADAQGADQVQNAQDPVRARGVGEQAKEQGAAEEPVTPAEQSVAAAADPSTRVLEPLAPPPAPATIPALPIAPVDPADRPFAHPQRSVPGKPDTLLRKLFRRRG